MKGYGNNGDIAPSWVAETPYIYNVTLTNANTEYSQLLPTGCKKFFVSIVDGVPSENYRIAYVTGKVATPTAPYLKFYCDVGYFENDVNLTNTTLYFASSNASRTMQIVAWT